VRVINNSAHLTIAGLTIRDGTTAGIARGGGIWNQSSGVLVITNSAFTNNFGYQGGAIYNSPGGSVSIADSSFTSNFGGAAVDANGGTIYNDGPGGVVAISGSSFGFNTTHDKGSALYNVASATIVNSTFVYNQAGISTIHNLGTLQINNATITGNVSNGRPGSGLAAEKSSSTAVQNSIIAGNFAQGGTKPTDNSQCDGPIGSGGYNIVGYVGSCGWVAATGDQLGTFNQPINPLLGSGRTMAAQPLPCCRRLAARRSTRAARPRRVAAAMPARRSTSAAAHAQPSGARARAVTSARPKWVAPPCWPATTGQPCWACQPRSRPAG
jgi:hypothetical protein